MTTVAAAEDSPVPAAVIDEGQRRFARLPFFRRLEDGSPDDARAFVPALAFFVMGFQDILRLNEARMRDPGLRALVRGHRPEDHDHEQWFLEDLRALGLELEVGGLFGPEHAATRDAAYAVMSEVFRANDDVTRLALILVLESTGEVFFSRVPRYVERIRAGGTAAVLLPGPRRRRAGPPAARRRSADLIDQMALSRARGAAAGARAMIARIYAAMTGMVQGFEARIAGRASREAVPLEASDDGDGRRPRWRRSPPTLGACRGAPIAVARPSSIGEVEALVRTAYRQGTKLTPRGMGLSQGGQSIADGSVALDLSMLAGSTIPIGAADDRVRGRRDLARRGRALCAAGAAARGAAAEPGSHRGRRAVGGRHRRHQPPARAGGQHRDPPGGGHRDR